MHRKPVVTTEEPSRNNPENNHGFFPLSSSPANQAAQPRQPSGRGLISRGAGAGSARLSGGGGVVSRVQSSLGRPTRGRAVLQPPMSEGLEALLAVRAGDVGVAAAAREELADRVAPPVQAARAGLCGLRVQGWRELAALAAGVWRLRVEVDTAERAGARDVQEPWVDAGGMELMPLNGASARRF